MDPALHTNSNTCTSLRVLTSNQGKLCLQSLMLISDVLQDLEELGWLALERSAAQRAASVKQMTLANTPGEAEQRHRAIVDLLTVRQAPGWRLGRRDAGWVGELRLPVPLLLAWRNVLYEHIVWASMFGGLFHLGLPLLSPPYDCALPRTALAPAPCACAQPCTALHLHAVVALCAGRSWWLTYALLPHSYMRRTEW